MKDGVGIAERILPVWSWQSQCMCTVEVLLITACVSVGMNNERAAVTCQTFRVAAVL